MKMPARDCIDIIREAICGSIEVIPLANGVRKVVTPFIDWKGTETIIYVRENGEITDGRSVINQMYALGVYDNYLAWPFKVDFEMRYSIIEQEGAFLPATPDNPQGILRYIQGISRLPLLFEAQPMHEYPDTFPRTVIDRVRSPLIRRIPHGIERDEWISQRLKNRILTAKGLSFTTDLSPVNEDLIIQIISHATIKSTTDKNQHVCWKLIPYEMAKQEDPNFKFIPIVPSLSYYPIEAKRLLEAESLEIIEVENHEADASEHIADLLAKSPQILSQTV